MDFVNKTRIYNKIPFLYDAWIRFWGSFIGGDEQMRSCALSLLAITPSDKVLDVCCGTGKLTLMIADKAQNGETVGLDNSPAVLNLAKRKDRLSRISFIKADAKSMPYAGNYFDKVVICGALHEMPKAARAIVLKEIYRVTKKGGRSLVIEPAYSSESIKARLVFNILFNPLNPESKTLKNMLKAGLVQEIAQSNFSVIKQQFSNAGFMQCILSEKI